MNALQHVTAQWDLALCKRLCYKVPLYVKRLTAHITAISLHSLTYITRQQTDMAASHVATRPGNARSATLFWGEALPKVRTVGLSIPRPKIHTAGGAPFPIPTYRHLPIPYLGKAVEPLPIPNIGEAVEP